MESISRLQLDRDTSEDKVYCRVENQVLLAGFITFSINPSFKLPINVVENVVYKYGKSSKFDFPIPQIKR